MPINGLDAATQNGTGINHAKEIENLALSAPGFIGELVNWILGGAICPQPSYALAAALSYASILKAHRVSSPTGICPNFYGLMIGDSGSGKNYPQKAIRILLERLHKLEFLLGRPASTAGLLKSLSTHEGRGLLVWDEFGDALLSLHENRVASHHGETKAVLKQLFSDADTITIGQEYVNADGKRPREDIIKPHLSLLGCATMEKFFSGLSGEDMEDGFLNRFVMFPVSENIIPDNSEINRDIPKLIIDQSKAILAMPTNIAPAGDIDEFLNVIPFHLDFAPNQGISFNALRAQFKQAQQIEKEYETKLHGLYVRGAELTMKIAMLACEEREISKEIHDWAASLAWHSIEYFGQAYKANVFESKREKDLTRVLAYIKKNCDKYGNGLQRWRITKAFQRLPLRDLDSILDTLCESHEIGFYLDENSGQRFLPYSRFENTDKSQQEDSLWQ